MRMESVPSTVETHRMMTASVTAPYRAAIYMATKRRATDEAASEPIAVHHC